jgi:hypothetical protein
VETNEEMHHGTVATGSRVGDERGRDRNFGRDCTISQRGGTSSATSANAAELPGESLVFFAVGKKLGLHHQTVERCVERALAYGPLAALDDRPRPGKEPTITSEAKAWLVSLACEKAKDHGYPHELRTTRLLARHARAKAPAAGMNVSLTWPRAQSARFSAKRKSSRTRCGTIWNGVMPSLSKRWRKCCVYREVQVLKKNTTISADHPVANCLLR